MFAVIKSIIVKPWVLIALLVAFVALTFGFAAWTPHVGGAILDSVTETGARDIIAGMNETQRTSHAWMTILLDIPYPLVYGLFFVGLTLKAFAGKAGSILALAGWLVIPLDLFENLVQVLALWGVADLLMVKNIVTPLKYLVFAVAALIAIVALLAIFVRWVRNSNAG